MGRAGRKIAGSKRAALVTRLKRAHADEWHAHYNFSFLAATLAGLRSPGVIALLDRISGESFGRAARLGRRLCELGGAPPRHLSDVPDQASDKPFRAPDDPTDVEGALQGVLDAQRTSIATYHTLWRASRDADPVTAGMAAGYLAEAVRDEEHLERLLKPGNL